MLTFRSSILPFQTVAATAYLAREGRSARCERAPKAPEQSWVHQGWTSKWHHNCSLTPRQHTCEILHLWLYVILRRNYSLNTYPTSLGRRQIVRGLATWGPPLKLHGICVQRECRPIWVKNTQGSHPSQLRSKGGALRAWGEQAARLANSALSAGTIYSC